MSGATMGGVQVAHAETLWPRPKTPREPAAAEPPADATSPEGLLTHVINSLTIVDLQLVTFIVVLGSSGNVPFFDLVFPIFASAYIAVLNGFVFPPTSREAPPRLFRGNRLFKVYVLSGALIGLFLPMAYILGGFSRGDTESVLASSPHLFLLSCQILTENVIHGFRGVSLPVRALTPILYNAVRLTSLYRWVTRVLTRDAPPISSEVLGRPLIIWSLLVNRDVNLWSSFGKALAVVNWLFWHFNLFGFLVCVFLPRAMAAYYQGKLPPQVLRPAKPPVKEADAEPNREHHSKKGQ